MYLLSDFLLREKEGHYHAVNIHYFRHYAETEQRRQLEELLFYRSLDHLIIVLCFIDQYGLLSLQICTIMKFNENKIKSLTKNWKDDNRRSHFAGPGKFPTN